MKNDFDQSKLIVKEGCREKFAAIFQEIDRLLAKEGDTPVLVAIDGKCAGGKTTLAYLLCSIYDCNLFHMDDFFLQDEQRTPKRLAEIGGNVDYERFKKEVLTPLCEGKSVIYRPFSCKDRRIHQGEVYDYCRLNIIEGSYSTHPYFGSPYALKIFMDIEEKDQLENIRKRNGEDMLERFKNEWIPKENAYFEKFHICDGCIICNWNEEKVQ